MVGMRRPSMKRGNISKAAAVRNSSTSSVELKVILKFAVKRVIDVAGSAVQAIGQAKAHFFLFGVGAIFEIADGGDLGFGGAFFLRGDGVGANGVFGFAKHGDAHGDEFLVPALQGAVAEQRLQKTGDAFGDVRRVGQSLEHVGDYATLGEQGVIEGGGIRCDGVAFEQLDAREFRWS